MAILTANIGWVNSKLAKTLKSKLALTLSGGCYP